MVIRSLVALVFIATAVGLKCWKGTKTTTQSSVNEVLDSMECVGVNKANYCSISFKNTSVSAVETFSCDSTEQCKSNGWNSNVLYCCDVEMCNEKSSAAINRSFRLLFAASVLIVFAFRYSQ